MSEMIANYYITFLDNFLNRQEFSCQFAFFFRSINETNLAKILTYFDFVNISLRLKVFQHIVVVASTRRKSGVDRLQTFYLRILKLQQSIQFVLEVGVRTPKATLLDCTNIPPLIIQLFFCSWIRDI
eukprot:TRINITY_DN14284_c0_g1_i2.p6 TRINITY_DN14284_c0_g1~~TRINITY_DN14284_c0_g1_i2.p6  ORF type:complete len:127 (+),score=0.67 TRINITY_DN14284_c0_g1_i2:736-1116(+)